MELLFFAQAAEVATQVDPSFISKLFASNELQNILLTLFVTLFGWAMAVARKRQKFGDEMDEGLRALETGVIDTVDMYKDFKRDNTGGKLTVQQRKALRDHALDMAKEVATGPGKKFLLRVGGKVIRKYIDKAVNKNKAAAQGGKGDSKASISSGG